MVNIEIKASNLANKGLKSATEMTNAGNTTGQAVAVREKNIMFF